MTGVITASEPSWTALFTGLIPCQFGKPITALWREDVNPVCKGRPWSPTLGDRVVLVAAYWRANLAPSQLAPLFGVSKSAADRIIDHLGTALALRQRKSRPPAADGVSEASCLRPARDRRARGPSRSIR